MPLPETQFCAEQIDIPPKLPLILKQFCKSAIRTQPYDLLKWSSAYFRALANGDEPPAKLRLEYPRPGYPYGLTLGFLKVLLRQLGADYCKVLPLDCILCKWEQLCLDRKDAELVIRIGRFRNKCQIRKFLAIALGLISSSIIETMVLVCELFTFEPDGGSAMIPLSLFMEIYGYLASLRCDGAERSSTEQLCLCSESLVTTSSCGCGDEAVCKESQPTASQASSCGCGPELKCMAHAPASSEASHDTSCGCGPELKCLAHGPSSVASQDTEADIELELDSAKEDLNSATATLRSFGEENEESFRHEGAASLQSTGRRGSSRSRTMEFEDKKNEASSKAPDEEMTMRSVMSALQGSKKSVEEVRPESLPVSDKCDEESHYPDVPGIGRVLVAQEIAAVAVWMSDWSRRQGGMVGPRNIRHVNCPPLDGCICARAQIAIC